MALARLGGGGSSEYYTPPHIVERARRVLGGVIDFDPASCHAANRIVRASHYLTAADNALRSDAAWRGPAVFVNPPYDGGTIRRFAERLLIEIHTGVVDRAVWVSNANTGAVAGQMILRAASAVCFLQGRLSFIDGRTGKAARRNRNDTMIAALGNVDLALFNQFFRRLGVVR